MVGGHFDSWQGGAGAADNGTGSSAPKYDKLDVYFNGQPRKSG
jgi:hypothetical protein